MVSKKTEITRDQRPVQLVNRDSSIVDRVGCPFFGRGCDGIHLVCLVPHFRRNRTVVPVVAVLTDVDCRHKGIAVSYFVNGTRPRRAVVKFVRLTFIADNGKTVLARAHFCCCLLSYPSNHIPPSSSIYRHVRIV